MLLYGPDFKAESATKTATILRILFFTGMSVFLLGCQMSAKSPMQPDSIQLPLIPGWYENRKVFYITTEASDQKMAARMNAIYAPRLQDALPNYPKPPGLKTVLERVYVFPETQYQSVFPSAPWPLGPENKDQHYSPIWLLYEVRWNPAAKPRQLTSEEAILQAEEKGLVSITRTDIIVNCPIVMDETGASLGIEASSGRY
ncbi:DUF7482 domain-containing protein [Hahella ganghwensis]|uniref:DUF7482 domain-containing protein n=1 Tax=Hahella ganghwensis TaxID=286420 RepID=UPI00037CFA7D|nr:hypothetical protein [Hahella ganghwensis]